MSRVYAVTFAAVAVTTTIDFFDIAPADDKICVIHGCYLSQSTELGDAAEEQLRIQIIRGLATVGSGGSAATPVPLNEHSGAAAATVRTVDTTVAVVGAGSTDVLHAETFNVRSGWVYLPTPEMRPTVKQTSTRLVVQLMAAPADSITMSGTLVYEEV